MDKELKLSNIKKELTLLFESRGTMMTMTKDEVRKWLVEDNGEEEIRELEENGGLSASYEKMRNAVYKCDNNNILILSSYCFDQEGETLPDLDDMIPFVDECLAKDLQENKKMIIYVSELSGTTLDYVLIFDDSFYDKVSKINFSNIVGEVIEYINNSKTDEKGHHWKYAKIINGEYSNNMPVLMKK